MQGGTMERKNIITVLGRRLRLGVIGGGPGSFIGAMHRHAARLDGCYEIVAGVLSSDPDRARLAGVEIGLGTERVYTSVASMLEAESAREDGVDVIAVMTPNDSHYEYAVAALSHGFDVICDKPMTNSVDEAQALHSKVRETGLVFCLTHNYTGYPMVRQAKAMVEFGDLGVIRLVQVEYVQGGRAHEGQENFSGRIPWRFDPAKGGPSLVMGDIGTHAHHLVRFISGLEIGEVAAEVGTIVPGRLVDDYAGALLRFENGARGSFWVTQAAAGVENCLRIRVCGTLGSLEWMQEQPQALTFKPLGGPSQNRTPNGPGTYPLAARASRIVAGHPEGFPAGFANLYSDMAEAVAARRTGTDADPLALCFPNSLDGLLGVRFISSMLESTKTGTWVKC